MSDDEPRTLRIASLTPVAKEQSVLALERDPILEPRYRRPGQYCQLVRSR